MVSNEQPNRLSEEEFLVSRYSHLNTRHMHHSDIIHKTFYLSVIFFGSLLAGLEQLLNNISPLILAPFSAGVFVALGLWTRTYLNGREDINRQRKNIIEEMIDRDSLFPWSMSATEAFPSDESRDRWEKTLIKNTLLQLYYAILVVLSLVLPFISMYQFTLQF